MKDCVFCKIVNGEIPATKVYEDDKFVGFMDIAPLNKGHVQLIPKVHYRWTWDVPEFGEYWEVAKKIALAQMKGLGAKMVEFLTHGMQVEHCHIWIVPTLMQKIGEAMKAHDAVRVSTLRMLLSELKNEKINKQHDLSEDEELIVVRKEAKKRKEAIEMYAKAGAEDKVVNEKAELTILSEFLPPEVTEEEMLRLVDETIKESGASTMQDMGKVIATVKLKNSGVDGGKIAEMVRLKLS